MTTYGHTLNLDPLACRLHDGSIREACAGSEGDGTSDQ